MDQSEQDHIVRDPDYQTRIRESFARQGFMNLIGAEISALEPGICEVAVNFRPDLTQQKGYFHGGIMGSLADTACGYSAYSLMAAEDSLLTVEYKINITGPGDGERLIARANVAKAGRRLTICEGRLYIEKAGLRKECGLVMATMMRLPQTSDAPSD
jgi:uncharacterized protein (TIGR00369 family)